MATLVTTPIAQAPFGFLKAIGSGIANFVSAAIVANSRASKLAYYTNMTDEELAARGMKREDIVYKVFPEAGFL